MMTRNTSERLTGPAPALIDRVLSRLATFESTLDGAQISALHQPHDAATVAAWSNLPQAVLGPRHGRPGLSTGTLAPAQWAALEGLLGVLTSRRGLDRVRDHLAVDDLLHRAGGRYGYGRGEFVVACLGTAAREGTWQLQFGGHHLALAFTFADGVLTGLTPVFRGIEPLAALGPDTGTPDPEGPTWRALRALLESLDEDQAAGARLSGSHDDLLLGPGQDWRFPARSAGLPAGDLDDGQRELLRAALARYVDDVEPATAARRLDRYLSALAETHLGWSGTTSLCRAGDYVRIDGPDVWIEFSMHDGVVLSGVHPHSVWRDTRFDYGGFVF